MAHSLEISDFFPSYLAPLFNLHWQTVLAYIAVVIVLYILFWLYLQYLTVQIDRDLLDTIIGNSGTTIAFRTNSPVDEEKLLPLFSPKVEKGQIQNLPSYTFYIKISALVPQDVFTGEVEKFEEKYDEEVAKEVIALSQKQYGRKINTETLGEVKKETEKATKEANPYKRGKK